MSPRSKQPPEEQARKILVEASPLAARLLLEALQEEDTPRSARLDLSLIHIWSSVTLDPIIAI